MLRLPFRALLVLPLLLALAGCCGNSACNCNDRLANSLFISIGRRNGTVNEQFSSRELATVYLARYQRGTTTLADQLPLPWATRRPTSYPVPLFPGVVAPQAGDTLGTLVISDNSPFSATTANGNLSQYDYVLLVPRDSSNGRQLTRRSFYRYVFNDLTVRGNYEADGCCTCYNNTDKRVRLSIGQATVNGQPTNPARTVDVAGETSRTTATRTPVILYLSKY